jgi:hypothetical protein
VPYRDIELFGKFKNFYINMKIKLEYKKTCGRDTG